MQQPPAFRLGTSALQAATGSPTWMADQTSGVAQRVARAWRALTPWHRGLGPDGVRGKWPAGIAHAVPTGTSVALCGASGLRLWDGPFTAQSRVLEPCAACVSLVGDG